MSTHYTRHAATLLFACVAACVTFRVFLPAVNHDFVTLDDDAYVTENPHVVSGPTRENLVWAFTSSHSANWHPLTWISHMIDCRVFGLRPAGHHLTSIVLHAVNAALVFLFLRLATGSLAAALLVALLFGLHPLRVESVAWVSERKDVLSAFFGLAALVAYAAYARRPGPARYATVALLLTLGLLAKPMLVTWPCLLLLLDYWPFRRFEGVPPGGLFVKRTARLTAEKVPLFVIAAAATTATFLAQKSAGAIVSVDAMPIPLRMGNAVISYAQYLSKTFWPAPLAVPYPFDPEIITLPRVLAATLLLAAITLAAALLRRRVPALFVGWLWFLGLLVPVIGLVQVGSQAMADRYTYLPSIGLAVAVVWTLAAAAKFRPVLQALLLVPAIAVLSISAQTTRWQLEHWRDSETLFRHAIAVTGDNSLAHNNLGKHLLGQYLRALNTPVDAKSSGSLSICQPAQLEEAAGHFLAAVRISPGNLEARNNLATAWIIQRHYKEAARELEHLLAVRGDDPELWVNYGAALHGLGETQAAAEAARRALELDPDFDKARELLRVAQPPETAAP